MKKATQLFLTVMAAFYSLSFSKAYGYGYFDGPSSCNSFHNIARNCSVKERRKLKNKIEHTKAPAILPSSPSSVWEQGVDDDIDEFNQIDQKGHNALKRGVDFNYPLRSEVASDESALRDEIYEWQTVINDSHSYGKPPKALSWSELSKLYLEGVNYYTLGKMILKYPLDDSGNEWFKKAERNLVPFIYEMMDFKPKNLWLAKSLVMMGDIRTHLVSWENS